MALPSGFLEELRRRTSLSELVARRVPLVRRGMQATGLCPFHKEKSPSFHVYESDGHYKCFGCGAYGDAISFLRETEGLEFREAVERLATEAGLEVPRDRPADPVAETRRRGLEDAMAAAVEHYCDALRAVDGAAVRDYLAKRGVTPGDLSTFKLGFAPADSRWLKSRLLADGFTEETLLAGGLLGEGKEGRPSYDYFRNRLMFPIADRRGRWIAFGGRVLDDSKPKYLNSPETDLFKKGRTLFAHHLARAAARRHRIIVTEGYLDVIAAHRAGFPGAVAPLGTALTEEQLIELWRMADEVVLCFDGDRAGRAAALKAADRALPLLEPGRALRVALLPEGQDPDDLLRGTDGPARFGDLVTGARPLIDLIWDAEVAAKPVDGPERLADLRKRLGDRVDRIGERQLRQDWANEVARRLRLLAGTPERGEGRRAPARPQPSFRKGRDARWNPDPNYRPAAESPVAAAPGARFPRQQVAAEALLRGLINHPRLIGMFVEPLAALRLEDPGLDRLRVTLVDVADVAEALDAETLRTHLTGLGYAALLGTLSRRSVARFASATAIDADAEGAQLALAGFLEHLGQPLIAAERKAVEAEAIRAANETSPELWDVIRTKHPVRSGYGDDIESL